MSIALLLAACTFRTVPADGDDDGGGDGGDGGDGGPTGGDGPMDDGGGSFLYRKRISIEPARVTGDQVQFPVWIVLDDAGLKAHATENGSDIHFTTGTGTPVAYQIQRWTKSTGRLEAWVRTDLSDNAATVLELRYGDPARASMPDPAQVFASPFEAVWHLDDPLDTSVVADATGKRPGDAGGLVPADQVVAQLGGGIDFDGGDDRIGFTNPFTGGGDHTFSAWVNQRSASGCDTIVTLGSPVGNQSRFLHAHNGGRLDVGFYNNDWPKNMNTLPNIENTGWVLLHWVFKGSNRQSRVYRNGVQLGSTYTFNGGVNTQGPDGNLGFAPPGWGTCFLNGILDEVRLATTERTAGWIATEHANQSSPQTFYSVGTEERLP